MADIQENTLSADEAASEFFIKGITNDGRQFRPSDWAERLCGVMSCFQPPGARKTDARLRYSPYVRPVFLEGVRSVLVNEDLRKLDPMAYHFVVNFAKDNDLQLIYACLLPDNENDTATTEVPELRSQSLRG